MLVKGDPALVSKVCNEISDPKLCSDTLNSDPSTANAATPYDIGLASLTLATAKASSTLDMIRRVINQNQVSNSDTYKICDNKYDIVISNLKHMKDAYVNHNYMDVRLRSLVVFEAIDDCVDAFNPSKPADIYDDGRYVAILVIVACNVKL
ncbi:hypothetical protein L2E82_11055 [Cichorium intybus]|uniref:Uncharacterized protein n=1 Tax=Cichorium intybus TaxID=13427 RepID=A0ACB9GCV1_CICIN|nr:hypothetical protein L2E82_11055 [Cichorium intybus]